MSISKPSLISRNGKPKGISSWLQKNFPNHEEPGTDDLSSPVEADPSTPLQADPSLVPQEGKVGRVENEVVTKSEEANFLDNWYLPKIVGDLAVKMDSTLDIRNLGLAQPAYQDVIAGILARDENWNSGVLKNEFMSKSPINFHHMFFF